MEFYNGCVLKTEYENRIGSFWNDKNISVHFLTENVGF